MAVGLSGWRKQKLLENAPFRGGGSDRARAGSTSPASERALFCILLLHLFTDREEVFFFFRGITSCHSTVAPRHKFHAALRKVIYKIPWHAPSVTPCARGL